jgi:hypothetical protein
MQVITLHTARSNQSATARAEIHDEYWHATWIFSFSSD